MSAKPNPPLEEHRCIVAWALACAERSLHVFARHTGSDLRPHQALVAAQEWIAGGSSADDVRDAALAAHAAARESLDDAARLAARSAAQAAGVVQSVRHAPHAASYARRAVGTAGGDADAELAWQRANADDVVRAFLLAQIEQPTRPSGDH